MWVSDWQSESDLDSICNSCNVFIIKHDLVKSFSQLLPIIGDEGDKISKKMMKLHVQRCNQRNGQWKCSQMCSCIRLACRTNRASSTLPILDEMFWWTGGESLKGWMVNPSKKHHGGRRHHLNLPHHQLKGGAPAYLAVAGRCVEWKT